MGFILGIDTCGIFSDMMVWFISRIQMCVFSGVPNLHP